MKKYIVDTNVFLRFLLKDHQKHYRLAKQYISQAKKGKIILLLIPEVVLEINYVLRSVYSLSRKEAADILASLVKSPDLNVKNREILIESVKKYQKLNVDLSDIFIFEVGKKEKAKVLSFDKDFLRIKKRFE